MPKRTPPSAPADPLEPPLPVCLFCLRETRIKQFKTKSGDTGLYYICGTCQCRVFAPPSAVHGFRRVERMLMHEEGGRAFASAVMLYDRPVDASIEAKLPGGEYEPDL